MCLGKRIPSSDESQHRAAEPWVQGSLFFETHDHDGILDQSLSRGVHLDHEHVRDALGLSHQHIEAVGRLVEELGGLVQRVSSLHDWMHISLPVSDRMVDHGSKSAFLERSLSPVMNNPSLEQIVHHVASALEAAGLDSLVSHMMLISDEKRGISTNAAASMEQEFKSSGRRLQQDDSQDRNDDNNQASSYLISKGTPEMFTANASEAVKNLGMWINSPVFALQCQGKETPYLVGKNTENCFLGVDILLQPVTGVSGTSSADPLTIRLNDLNQFGKTCAEVPDMCAKLNMSAPTTEDTYLYGIPLYKYTKPNVLYSGSTLFTANTSEGIGLDRNDLPALIYNYYNASALTIRDLYGVDPSIQGSPDNVQASLLAVGNADSAVNVTAVNEYLSYLGLEPHSQLRIREFGVPNNISVCSSTDNCVESMLDTQTLQSFAPNATTYFTPSSEGNNPKEVAQLFLSFLDDALKAKPQTQVASLSWTWDYVDTADLPIQALEGYLKKLAAVGMTILVSSGDSGASGDSDGCYAATGNGPLTSNFLSNSWPTASPWVTSVGGTQLLGLGEDLETKEVSCSSSTSGGITSGGGFSATWLNASTPSWQKRAVSKYLEENNATTFTGFPTLKTPGYNPGGRGYPDIAAYAAYIPILDPSGNIMHVSGTSLSTPLMASLFTLANQKLLNDGYSLIGYANPMLYWMAENCPEAFNDITIGDNQFGESGYLCQYGYPAAVGWDPVTGLGSINFNPFVECVKVYQDLKL